MAWGTTKEEGLTSRAGGAGEGTAEPGDAGSVSSNPEYPIPDGVTVGLGDAACLGVSTMTAVGTEEKGGEQGTSVVCVSDTSVKQGAVRPKEDTVTKESPLARSLPICATTTRWGRACVCGIVVEG